MNRRSVLRIRAISLCLLPVLAVFLSVFCVASPAAANEKYAALVVDGNTGRTLYARNADARRYPASLTKMMTLYVLFDELEARRLTLNTRLSVSANAAAQAPSKLGLKAGKSIKVQDAILALTTKSANDIAVVVAENVSGSVAGFAARMNRTARSLGMRQTTFRNPHGLPDAGQYTTARDLVVLARALQDNHPTYYRNFGVRTFTYAGVRHRNHNHLLGSVEGVDGIKTGYTRASGFNLVTNVRRDGRHVIAVVMGGKTASSRDAEMRKLIADYLPAAKRGRRSDALVVAEVVAEEEEEMVVAEAEVRTPRPRPAIETDVALAYAGTEPATDTVTLAMVEAAAPGQGDAPEEAAGVPTDQIADRISSASAVAQFALADPEVAAGASSRLVEMARQRAGGEQIVAAPGEDIVAAAAAPVEAAAQPAPIEFATAPEPAAAPVPAGDPDAGEAGWHIQIGAVPTMEGAHALLESAQASMGPVLASLHPLTQPVERNGTTLYRARFAGFPDKEQARAACAKLQMKSIDCLAVPN